MAHGEEMVQAAVLSMYKCGVSIFDVLDKVLASI